MALKRVVSLMCVACTTLASTSVVAIDNSVLLQVTTVGAVAEVSLRKDAIQGGGEDKEEEKQDNKRNKKEEEKQDYDDARVLRSTVAAAATMPAASDFHLRAAYLDTLRDTLTGVILRTHDAHPSGQGGVKIVPFNPNDRREGITWCVSCFTMAGTERVQNVRTLIEETIAAGVPGDFLEAGTWRGGSSIMARAVQRSLGEGKERRTYVCDSFEGLPESTTVDDSDVWSEYDFLRVSKEQVQANFHAFGMLDENVKFVKGFFVNSLPPFRAELQASGRQLAVLRGDGDMYESYLDILYNLYEFVPVGGYFICDDCPYVQPAQEAIDDFRKHHGITEPISTHGLAYGSFWRKERAVDVDYDKYLAWNATRQV